MSKAKKKVRIGFIGAGTMGQGAHLRNYATFPEECEIVALAELRPQTAKLVAAKYGIPKVYSTHQALLENEKVDALVASQPFTQHGVLLPELAKAGVPIFSEKPIAGNLRVADQIINALNEYKTWMMVGYHKRSDPASIYAKAEIQRLQQTGEVGQLRYIRITIPPGDWVAGGLNENINTSESVGNLPQDPLPDDMSKETTSEFIAFVNYYVHHVNLLRHLFGEDYKLTYVDPSNIVLIARSVSGVTGVIEMNPYCTSVEWHETALVSFDRGYVKLSLPAPLAVNRPGRVEIFKDPGHGTTPITLTPDLPWDHAMRNQALNFIKAVRGEAPAPCLAPEALLDLQVSRDYIRLLKGL